MKLLAISGSMRAESTNTYFLQQISYLSAKDVQIEIFSSHDELPIFHPDKQGEHTPTAVLKLCKKIALSDGIIISSPEYIKSIPGGLKNTIDWLVARDEIICKPIVLVHASHRGEDVLQSLRRVLSTISKNFSNDIFLQVSLLGKNEREIKQIIYSDKCKPLVHKFLNDYCTYIELMST